MGTIAERILAEMSDAQRRAMFAKIGHAGGKSLLRSAAIKTQLRLAVRGRGYPTFAAMHRARDSVRKIAGKLGMTTFSGQNLRASAQPRVQSVPGSKLQGASEKLRGVRTFMGSLRPVGADSPTKPQTQTQARQLDKQKDAEHAATQALLGAPSTKIPHGTPVSFKKNGGLGAVTHGVIDDAHGRDYSTPQDHERVRLTATGAHVQVHRANLTSESPHATDWAGRKPGEEGYGVTQWKPGSKETVNAPSHPPINKQREAELTRQSETSRMLADREKKFGPRPPEGPKPTLHYSGNTVVENPAKRYDAKVLEGAAKKLRDGGIPASKWMASGMVRGWSTISEAGVKIKVGTDSERDAAQQKDLDRWMKNKVKGQTYNWAYPSSISVQAEHHRILGREANPGKVSRQEQQTKEWFDKIEKNAAQHGLVVKSRDDASNWMTLGLA